MSNFRGRGRGRRHQADDRWEHDVYEAFESPAGRLRTDIIRLGEVDPEQEVPRLAKKIRDETGATPAGISEALRIGVTEQPYKIPYYATLLRHLYEPVPGDNGGPLGQHVLDDFCKGFRAFLDKLAWRETRLCIQFFAHLTVAGMVSVSSMSALLQSFIAVLDEFGVPHGRAKRAALCAAEGIMLVGSVLKDDPSTSLADMVASIQSYVDSTATYKSLVQPMIQLHNPSGTAVENADEILDTALSALAAFGAAEFAQIEDSVPRPYTQLADLDPSHTPFDLPSVLVPPEVIDIETDGMSADAGSEGSPMKREEWAEYYLRLFDNDVTPDPTTPAGYIVRSNLLDIVDIFEVNRKECARLLLEYPRWAPPGTFRPRPGVPPDVKPIVGKDWQLESTIVETILGTAFLLPEPPHKLLYYITLITELCKLSPSTVGPAVGKSIRRLYGALADGLDVEIARRFAEWFAIHMSNFGFQWVWKEWIPDLALSVHHPKRVFMLRAIEFEIRLSYFDRIIKTLPEPFHDPGAQAVPPHAPGPNFEYDDPANPYHDAAQSILGDLRGRSKAEDVIAHIDTLRNSLLESGEENSPQTVRAVAVQSLLNIGSRSFSHFLNAIERYLPLLRSLAPTPEAKAEVLAAASTFWRDNRQMVHIVFDKLMQYQVVDPTDVVRWTFADGGAKRLTAQRWDLLKGALDKANGRVVVARRRVAALRKEEDDNRARAKAVGNGNVAAMEVDADTKPEEEDVAVDSPALVTALKALASLTREQRGALSTALEAFVSCLAGDAAQASAGEVITERAWHNRANWAEDEWSAWETWAWYRQFCRAYSPYLRNYAHTIGTVSFARFDGSTDPAAQLLKSTWNVAILEA